MAAPTHAALEDRYWKLIESAPDSASFREAVAKLGAADLVGIAAHVIVARNLVRLRDEGPMIDGARLSPIVTEDLTEWVVSRGQARWSQLCGAPDAILARAYKAFLNASTPQLLGEIFFAHQKKSDRDLNDAVDARLAALE